MCTVEDIDAVDLTKAKISLNRKRVLPLPQWRANPSEDGDALHSEGSTVMALYPQTTCFYKGVVASIPEGPSDNYIVLFEDATYPNGIFNVQHKHCGINEKRSTKRNNYHLTSSTAGPSWRNNSNVTCDDSESTILEWRIRCNGSLLRVCILSELFWTIRVPQIACCATISLRRLAKGVGGKLH